MLATPFPSSLRTPFIAACVYHNAIVYSLLTQPLKAGGIPLHVMDPSLNLKMKTYKMLANPNQWLYMVCGNQNFEFKKNLSQNFVGKPYLMVDHGEL